MARVDIVAPIKLEEVRESVIRTQYVGSFALGVNWEGDEEKKAECMAAIREAMNERVLELQQDIARFLAKNT